MVSKLYLTLGLVVVGLIALAVIARNWSCKPVKPPRPPRTQTYTVSSVISGACIEVFVGHGERRTAKVWLRDIEIPSKANDAATANLERLAGKTIRVETPRLILRGTEGEAGSEPEKPEARRDIVGVAYGECGAGLNLAQVMDGWATCGPTAPTLWKAEEQRAKKAGRGMWK